MVSPKATVRSPALSPRVGIRRLACVAVHPHDGGTTKTGFKAMGGWRFGNTIDVCQAEYVLVSDAMANLCPVPDELTDEQVLMCPDIMSTGFQALNAAVSISEISSRSSLRVQ